ncbi:MAG TPA: UDP-N-acetylglucosamine 1-carboxyvinyltransferase [Acidimicrobiales bacterium]|nr:UDP-N-acetylglucosamine 1-carboxyvinyltransferase [Acidimicrobiales bacterium]
MAPVPDASAWKIEPAGPLRGEVRVGGSKNAVTKLMVAALLADGPSTILNAPYLGDVAITSSMLQSLGAGVAFEDPVGSAEDGADVVVDPVTVTDGRIPVSYTGLNRVPILLLGPLLHRVGEVFVPLVGGDPIGARPVDFHVEAIRRFGAEVELTPEGLEAKAIQLHGAHIRLPFPSVGATESVLVTAAKAEGRTTLENAAIEPEVVELALFLQRMGARIEMQPDRVFIIEGVPRLSGARQRLGGDRIEALSYLVAGLATGGRVRVRGCSQDRLVTAISTLQRMGAHFEISEDGIAASAEELRPAAVQTSTHPGFMTDWQPPLVVLFTQVPGMSVVHETVFEDRLGYVEALRALGAEVELFEQCLVGQACRFQQSGWQHSALVRGVTPLDGGEMVMPDVRGAFAYVIAAAAAQGPSTLRGVHHLERGYDRPLEKFSELGLRITPT